ncbi:MAG: hypothetical protein ACHQ50_16030 [Fimbriimonadales bacterium]
MLALAIVLVVSSPYLPFPRRAEIRFTPTLIPHSGDIAGKGVDPWRDLFLSDDGRFALFDGGRYRWVDLPGGRWSDEEAIYTQRSGTPEVYTTSQEAHLPRSPTRGLANRRCIAVFSDRSTLAMVSLDKSGRPFEYSGLIRFDERGQRPNPMVGLRRGVADDVLTRQDSASGGVLVFGLASHGKRIRVTPIQFHRSGNGFSVRYRSPMDLPCYVHRNPGFPDDVLPPFAIDMRLGRALYFDYVDVKVGKRFEYHLHLHEYLIRARRWREVAAPPGFDRYVSIDGMFYWQGRLLFSPQYPNGIPDKNGKLDFPQGTAVGSEGIYEASENRKQWRKIADCRVLTTSPNQNVWLVLDPRDNSCWLETLR